MYDTREIRPARYRGEFRHLKYRLQCGQKVAMTGFRNQLGKADIIPSHANKDEGTNRLHCPSIGVQPVQHAITQFGTVYQA
jgi:hypothetical protein